MIAVQSLVAPHRCTHILCSQRLALWVFVPLRKKQSKTPMHTHFVFTAPREFGFVFFLVPPRKIKYHFPFAPLSPWNHSSSGSSSSRAAQRASTPPARARRDLPDRPKRQSQSCGTWSRGCCSMCLAVVCILGKGV